MVLQNFKSKEQCPRGFLFILRKSLSGVQISTEILLKKKFALIIKKKNPLSQKEEDHLKMDF